MSSKHFTGFSEWSRARAIFPKNHIILPMAQKKKNFVESFHNDKSEPTMQELISFEFSRKYFKERDCFNKLQKELEVKQRRKKKIIYKKKPVKPDPSSTIKKFKLKKFENIPSRVEHRRNIGKNPVIVPDEECKIIQNPLNSEFEDTRSIVCPIDDLTSLCCIPSDVSSTIFPCSENVPIYYNEPYTFLPTETTSFDQPTLCTGA